MAATLNLIVLLVTLLALTASSAHASHLLPATPKLDRLSHYRATLNTIRERKCLPRMVYRWRLYEVPPAMRSYVVLQTKTWIFDARDARSRCLSSPVALGRHMAAVKGWTGYQWDALYRLWNAESGWSPWAVNRSSGACGIPQQHPCSLPLGQARPQIRWGLGYIAGRYGSPAGAWAFFNANDWY